MNAIITSWPWSLSVAALFAMACSPSPTVVPRDATASRDTVAPTDAVASGIDVDHFGSDLTYESGDLDDDLLVS